MLHSLMAASSSR